jgi:hypothetical protein
MEIDLLRSNTRIEQRSITNSHVKTKTKSYFCFLSPNLVPGPTIDVMISSQQEEQNTQTSSISYIDDKKSSYPFFRKETNKSERDKTKKQQAKKVPIIAKMFF